MGEDELTSAEIWLDRAGENGDDVEPAARQDHERQDNANHNRTHNPEQTMSQLLEVIEEGHFGICGSPSHLRF
jgi:RNA polymerase-binding transcription factor DksA